MKKGLLVVLCFSISYISFAQGWSATLVKTSSTTVEVRVKPSANNSTSWSDIEFFLRWPTAQTAGFSVSSIATGGNFAGVGFINGGINSNSNGTVGGTTYDNLWVVW